MSRQPVSPNVRAVRERLDALRQLPRDEIATLPRAGDMEVSVEGKRHQLVVWHESRGSGEEWVVMQLYHPVGLGAVRRVHGEGFALSVQGDQRPLTAAEADQFTW